MNENQVKGHIEEVKGKVKEVIGKTIGDKKMEHKGQEEKVKGKIQTAYGDAKDKIKKSI